MYILDTDHVSILKYGRDERRDRLFDRMNDSIGPFAITPVTVEEQMRGWLLVIRRTRSAKEQVAAYERLTAVFGYLGEFEIAPFDEAAAARFERLQRAKIRIGTMDLKIAAIALVNDATLLTANVSDFAQVPGLKTENWLD